MIYIFLAMIFYAIAILFGATASRHMDTNLASLVTNFVSTIIPVGVIAGIFASKKQAIISSRFGVFAAVMCGVAVAVYVLAINKAYATNKVAIVAPVILGGALLLSTVGSYIIFKEKISPLQAVGLALLFIGLGFVVYARATGK